MALLDNGWTEEQAQGLLDSLNLEGGTPKWKWEHLQKLRDWCSANEKDLAPVEGQLEFIAYGLFKQAKTVREAREAVEPYMK